MKARTMARLSGLFWGGLLLVGPIGIARADQPSSAQEADARAQTAEQQAAQYRELGGVGYKTGLVQRAEADASRYSDMAERMASPQPIFVYASPEAEHYARLADQYKLLGGVAYKTGLVQRAEADQRRAEEEAGPAPAPFRQLDPWAAPDEHSSGTTTGE